MEDSFASLIGSAATDHSVSDSNWCFWGHEDHSSDSTIDPMSDPKCIHHHGLSDGFQETTFANSTKDLDSFYFPGQYADEFENDPFSLRCRIPVPRLRLVSRYHTWLETSFMCRRNERERQRVRNVNDGFSRLRNHLPRSANMRRRQSKVETLQHAIKYIKYLQDLLKGKKETGEHCQ